MMNELELARSVFDEMVRLRRILHQNPELSGEEHQTLAFLCRQLDEWGITHVSYSNGGICACIGQGETAIGLRADIDALPVQEQTGLPYASKNAGVMHACGHDVHTAILLGAAKLFKSMEERLPCMVKLFFQPAEETTGGAKVMIDEGCMAEPPVTNVLSLHVDPTLPLGCVSFLPGKMNAAVIDLTIIVRGKAGHGAHPEQGVDSIVTAAQIISALQTVDSRMTAPTNPVVVTIGSICGGTCSNVLAEEVTMHGTVRVLDMQTARQVKEHIRRLVTSIAAAWGAQAEVILTDDYPALVNDADVTLALAQQARRLLGNDKVILCDTPSMGADDFAYFTNEAPGCYFNLGTTPPDAPAQSLHSEKFAPHEDSMLTALALLCAGVFHLSEKEP